ncbi:superoxide dismutase [Candidatus Amesbacteria bacterium]|nr:superoxide dismutase [Candidatus Amesbacteria bacterium]
MFTLPDLPYATDALEPYIDKQTMEIHHGKHHAAYVKVLNDLVPDQTDPFLLLKHENPKVRNNAGGHINHSLFWTFMSPNPSNPPRFLDSFGDFKEKFTAVALGRFGSGWAWLVQKDGKLEIVDTPNQDVPEDKILLGLDVWEHAYYLKYQNRRADYIENWWHVINWTAVSANFARGQA